MIVNLLSENNASQKAVKQNPGTIFFFIGSIGVWTQDSALTSATKFF
jgi:hypothetical protein